MILLQFPFSLPVMPETKFILVYIDGFQYYMTPEELEDFLESQ